VCKCKLQNAKCKSVPLGLKIENSTDTKLSIFSVIIPSLKDGE
jgi:hypothetical protein